MTRRWLLVGLTAVFCGLTVLTAIVAVVLEPFVLLLTAVFGVTTYVLWFHVTGRLRERVVRTTRARYRARSDPDTGGFGAGPRGPFRSRRRRTRNRRSRTQRQREQPTESTALSTTQAYEVLGVAPGADQSTIKDAYREKAKTLHPDSDTGDADAFQEVTAAYERLSS